MCSRKMPWTVLRANTASAASGSRALCCCLLAGVRSIPVGATAQVRWLNVVAVALAAGLAGSLGLGRPCGRRPKASRASSIRPPTSCIWSRPRPGSARSCRSRCFLPPPATKRHRSPLHDRRRCAFRLSASSASARCSSPAPSTPGISPAVLPALTETDYGRLLLLKIALFLGHGRDRHVQPACALTPRLVQNADACQRRCSAAPVAPQRIASKSQPAPSSSPSLPFSAPIRRALRRSSTLTITIDASERPL